MEPLLKLTVKLLVLYLTGDGCISSLVTVNVLPQLGHFSSLIIFFPFLIIYDAKIHDKCAAILHRKNILSNLYIFPFKPSALTIVA